MGTTTTGDPSSGRRKRQLILVGLVAAALAVLWLQHDGDVERGQALHRGPGGREDPISGAGDTQVPSAPDVRPVLKGQRPARPQSRIEAEADARGPVPSAGGAALVPVPPGVSRSGPKGHGTLLDHDGSRVAHAVVQLWIESETHPADLRLWKQLGTDKEGRLSFELPPRPLVRLVAWSERSAATEFVPNYESGWDLGELRLQAGLSISGAVRAPPNSLLHQHVGISATRAGTSNPQAPAGVPRPGSLFESSPAALERRERTTLTDAEGRWLIEGLSPGIYEVQALTHLAGTIAHKGLDGGQRRTVEAPASNVDFDVTWSLVHLDPHPDLLEGERWVEVRARLTDAEGRTSEIWPDMCCDWEETKLYKMPLRPGAAYRVDLSANGYLPTTLSHVAAPAGEETRVPIRLTPAPRGTLRLNPPLDRNARIRTASGRHVRVELFEGPTGESVYEESVDVDHSGLAGNVPVGTWTLSLTPWCATASLDDSFDLQQTQVITVRANSETVVQVDPPQGGRLALKVRAPDHRLRSCTCLIERPHAAPRSTMMNTREAGGLLWSWSDSLYTETRYEGVEAFPPEPLTLLLSAPGYRTTRVVVRPEAGRLLAVDLALELE